MTAGDGATYAPTAGQAAPVCEPGDFTFAAVGLDHGHIYGMCNGLLEAGAGSAGSTTPIRPRSRFLGVTQTSKRRSEPEALDDPT